MNLLIVSATVKEIKPLLKMLTLKNDLGGRLKTYYYNNKEIDVLITGVGMTATAFWLGKMLSDRYDVVLNLGVCGSFRREIGIGEVVNVVSDLFSDLGTENGEEFLDVFEMDLIDENEFPFNNGKLTNDFKNDVSNSLKTVHGITVNTVHGNEKSIKKTIDLLAKSECMPDVESMEGAAFFYACMSEGIPCLQIRAVSNYVERRNKENWNIPLAIEALNEKVLEIINSKL
ncbi:MAG: futalosine hydrolase [Flavobacteriales bacterium]|nr:MAG: futalosine hydrolase [Flavobacteriales bacterium]